MSETQKLKSRKGRHNKGTVPFYGARKSRNEVYFQMASLFKEVTRGQDHLSSQWLDRIIVSSRTNNPGNLFTDNL